MKRVSRKFEWQVKAEAEAKDARAIQIAFDGLCRLYPDLTFEQKAASSWDEAIAEDAARVQGQWWWALETFRRSIKSGQEKVDKLAEGLKARPAYQVLEWSADAFKAAVEVQVNSMVLAQLETRGPEGFDTFLTYHVINAARQSVPRSSSVPSNLLDALRAEEWARILESQRSGWRVF